MLQQQISHFLNNIQKHDLIEKESKNLQIINESNKSSRSGSDIGDQLNSKSLRNKTPILNLAGVKHESPDL